MVRLRITSPTAKVMAQSKGSMIGCEEAPVGNRSTGMMITSWIAKINERCYQAKLRVHSLCRKTLRKMQVVQLAKAATPAKPEMATKLKIPANAECLQSLRGMWRLKWLQRLNLLQSLELLQSLNGMQKLKRMQRLISQWSLQCQLPMNAMLRLHQSLWMNTNAETLAVSGPAS